MIPLKYATLVEDVDDERKLLSIPGVSKKTTPSSWHSCLYQQVKVRLHHCKVISEIAGLSVTLL